MQLEKLRELQLLAAPQPGRPLHLSAASGLVRVGSTFYVVADDELHLGVFALAGRSPGTLIRMFTGSLPDAAPDRKRHKPDLEALTLLPGDSSGSAGALLALGSGSKARRRGAVWLPLDAHGVDAAAVRVLDVSDLLEGIEAQLGALNIEGAVVLREQLVLMHRGHRGDAGNCLVSIDLPPLLAVLARGGDVIARQPIVALRRYALGEIDGVPLCFTDGAVLPNGGLVFAAVAEDTGDSYHDGPCRGAAIGVIDSGGNLRSVTLLTQPHKIEGIHAELRGAQVEVWLVTDADDASVPASLLTGMLP